MEWRVRFTGVPQNSFLLENEFYILVFLFENAMHGYMQSETIKKIIRI